MAGRWQQIRAEIDAGRPVLVVFAHWNLVNAHTAELPCSDSPEVQFCDWADFSPSGDSNGDGNPDEYYNYTSNTPTLSTVTGHAVTVVGYVGEYDPDGEEGPLPNTGYVVVHDGWTATGLNVAVPWWDLSHPERPLAYWKSDQENPSISWWISNVTMNPDALTIPGGNVRLRGKVFEQWNAWDFWD